jgi:hypothetical protein
VKNRMREFPHVRVCEGWGRQRPHLLGDDPSTASGAIRRRRFIAALAVIAATSATARPARRRR